MRLFAVVQITMYLGDGKCTYRPACKEIIVIKETPKAFLVDPSIGSGWGSRIFKSDLQVSYTEVEAWDKWIAKARKVQATMRMELTYQAASITFAVQERNALASRYSEDEIKIGGTD